MRKRIEVEYKYGTPQYMRAYLEDGTIKYEKTMTNNNSVICRNKGLNHHEPLNL